MIYNWDSVEPTQQGAVLSNEEQEIIQWQNQPIFITVEEFVQPL